MKERGELSTKRRVEYREALDRLRAVVARQREPRSDGEKELHQISRWVLDQWKEEKDQNLLVSPTNGQTK
jgi:hypothetical protein